MGKNNDNSEAEGELSLDDDLVRKMNLGKIKVPKIKEHNKPVFHLCNFKRLRDDEDSSSTLKMEATFIQVVFHDKKQEKKITAKEEEQKDTNPSFQYRINNKKPNEEDCQLRSERKICESDDKYITKTILDVILPLEITPIFTKYPLTIYKAEVSIELVSKILQDVTFRPKIAINTKDLTQNFTIEKDMDELDKSKKFDFITRCPAVQYFMDSNKKKQCKKFKVDFLLIDDGIGKLIKFYLPFLLISIISTVNALYYDAEHGESLTFADYVQTSSAMALAFVFLIPEVAESTLNQFLRTVGNTMQFIFIILGLMLASFPPSFKFPMYKIGILFLWSSFCFPIYNFFSYWFKKRRMERESCEVIHYDVVEGGKFQIEDIKDYEYVSSQIDNFFYPEDEETDEVNKTECKKKAKGFLYRRPTVVGGKSLCSVIILICYICFLSYVMRDIIRSILISVDNITGYNILIFVQNITVYNILIFVQNITGYKIMDNMECVNTDENMEVTITVEN